MDPKLQDHRTRAPYTLSYRRRYQNKTKVKPKQTKVAIFKESLRTVSKEYCAESTIGGLEHLVNENSSFVERIIWIITLVMALACSVSLVWVTFHNYYTSPLVTTQMPEGVSVSMIVFPAVGVCTNNRISKRAVTELAKNLLKEDRNKNYSESEMLELLQSLGQMYNMYPMDEDELNATMRLHKALGYYNINALMKSLTPRCEDIMVQCAWNEVPKSCMDLFDFRLTQDGYCCTFNYLRISDTNFREISDVRGTLNHGNKSTFDFDQGLKILMRINESDDFYYNMPVQGAKLQFSDAYDFPDAPSGSFAMQIINPNVQMSVLVQASLTEASRDIQHVSVKLRGCLFNEESDYLPFYTSSDCRLKCRMYFLLEKCKCTPFNMPKRNKSKSCDFIDLPCVQKYFAQSITERPNVYPIPEELELDKVDGGIFCPMCYPTCSITSYSYDFYNVNIYPDQMNTVPDEDRNDIWLRGANFTGTSIVHVKYAREVADRFGQNVIMKWFDLISNIGSTCGFVTGFSFVSVLEFVYFFTVKMYREVRTRCQQQNRIANVAEPGRTVVPFEPITRYRPIYWNELAGATRMGPNTQFD